MREITGAPMGDEPIALEVFRYRSDERGGEKTWIVDLEVS